MRRSWIRNSLICCLVAIPAGLPAQVIITEFVASNRTGLDDGTRTHPDWFELHNTGDSVVDLDGWGVSDDIDEPFRWIFPAVELAPGGYLVVFASGRDERDPTEPLHTNFRLNRETESLMLTRPSPEIVSIHVDYPMQHVDISYGHPMEVEIATVVDPETTPARWFVPENDDLGRTWTELGFDDTAWSEGPMPLGFDVDGDPALAEAVRTDLADAMHGVSSSVYLRIPFELTAEQTAGQFLRLRSRNDDGLVAYVNGVEVAALGASTRRDDNARSGRRRSDAEALAPEFVIFEVPPDVLRAGENVLAVQGLNRFRSEDDFLIEVGLESIDILEVRTRERVFFGEPSPGAPNIGGFPALAEPPTFSIESRAFVEEFTLELEAEPGASIRYTLDGSEPSVASPVFVEPIPIDTTLVVKARTFQDGLLPSVSASQGYVRIHPSIVDRDSNLPILILNTFGQPVLGCNQSNKTPAHVHLIDRGDDGRASLTGTPTYSGPGGIKKRGASTCGRSKFSMNLEIWDAEQEDMDVSFFGWGPESDYVLWGAYNFDHTLIRNPLIYELSNQTGNWAPRTQFAEVYLNTGRGIVTAQHYYGVYSIIEKIKQSPHRVDVQELEPEQTTPPAITGGYIFKIDRNQQGEPTATAPGSERGSAVIEEPKGISPAQRNYLSRRLSEMNQRLNRFDDLDDLSDIIDIPSWIDHHILMTFPKNVDAFRLSGFLHMRRGGIVHRGPIWDYDRTMGSTDGRDRVPNRWENSGGDGGTRYFTSGWYGRLFRPTPGVPQDAAGPPPLGDDEWATRYRARWRELREGPLSTENILAVTGAMADELAEAWPRNHARWRQGSTQAVAMRTLENWLTTRVEWIDSQFLEPPSFSRPGGDVDEPFDLEITTLNGEIWYTINGPDPRGARSEPSDEAVRYEGPIRVDRNMRVTARSRVGERTWSAAVTEVYIFERVPLVITELMYNPLDESVDFNSTDFEFLELLNTGSEAVDLRGVSFSGRIRFEFEGAEPILLEPGEYTVIPQEIEAFRFRYGDGVRVDGEYRGILSNSGQNVELLGSLGEVLVEFTYDDGWYPETDGDGHSLVLADPLSPRDTWSSAAAWRPSLEIHGSPGRDDTAGGLQRPADFDQDSRITVSDAVGLLLHIFRGTNPLPCGTEGGNVTLLDADGDSRLGLSDGVHVLRYLFNAGAPPALGLECVPVDGCPEACES